jgi:hypothetical protein
MKEKMIIGIIGAMSVVATSIPIYNYYILPVIRHKEMMDKIDGFDKRLKKIEKSEKRFILKMEVSNEKRSKKIFFDCHKGIMTIYYPL